MPTKKKKKTKVRKKTSKKVRKKTKVRKKIKIKKQITDSSEELIIKTRPEWIKSSLATKNKYQDKYTQSIKKMMNFGEKKEKGFLGSNHIKKLKM